MVEVPLKDGEYEVQDGDRTYKFKIRTCGERSLICGKRLISVAQEGDIGRKPWLKFGFIEDDGTIEVWKRYQYNTIVDPSIRAARRIVQDGVFVQDNTPCTNFGGWRGRNPEDGPPEE